MMIDPGYYRVRMKRVFYDRKDRTLISYLRVTMQGKDMYFQVDEGIPYKVNPEDERFELDRFELIGKVEKPISIHKTKITIRFQDDEGYWIEMQAQDMNGLTHIFREFPRLERAVTS